MNTCLFCGQNLEPSAHFCSRCGTARPVSKASSKNTVERALDFLEAADPDNWGRRYWPLWLAISLVGTGIFIAGLLFFLGKSVPAEMTVKILRESPVARQALGEIQDVGWANGGITTTSGGSGTANFTVSVKGSLAKGKFYSYFVKRHDLWTYDSGRLRIDGGPSINIPPP